MDGPEGYGSSFLEEAFGGLVRKTGITWDEFNKIITIQTNDVFLIDEIKSYMIDASDNLNDG